MITVLVAVSVRNGGPEAGLESYSRLDAGRLCNARRPHAVRLATSGPGAAHTRAPPHPRTYKTLAIIDAPRSSSFRLSPRAACASAVTSVE